MYNLRSAACKTPEEFVVGLKEKFEAVVSPVKVEKFNELLEFVIANFHVYDNDEVRKNRLKYTILAKLKEPDFQTKIVHSEAYYKLISEL